MTPLHHFPLKDREKQRGDPESFFRASCMTPLHHFPLKDREAQRGDPESFFFAYFSHRSTTRQLFFTGSFPFYLLLLNPNGIAPHRYRTSHLPVTQSRAASSLIFRTVCEHDRWYRK